MSGPDIAQPQRRSEARARAAPMAAARGAVSELVQLEGARGNGIAAIQSAAVDACGLGLGKAHCFLALSLLQQQAGGGAVMAEGAEGIGWAGATGGEVEVTVRRSPTALPEPLTISALLQNS
eukprot:542140-Pleurochrysis_carterae.AAC.1